MLNNDQTKALKFIKDWWSGNNMYCIMNGAGGTGKTYLLNQILKELPVTPLILTPTHEALKQVREKVDGDYIFRTLHSALGIAPTTTEKDLSFEHLSLPSLWEDINLAIVDEASMVPGWIIDLLLSTKARILYVGHKSQLPPIVPNRKMFDKCISPVFEKPYPTVTLKEPMRNKGKLWDFNNYLEEMIYTKNRIIPNDFDIKKKELEEILFSKEGIAQLQEGALKVVAWSNMGVDNYNKILRNILYGEKSAKKYLTDDIIILTAPLTVVDNLERHSDYALKRLLPLRDDLTYLYSNSKGRVEKVDEVWVKLNNELNIPCWKLYVDFDGEYRYIYEPKHFSWYQKIEDYYEHIAWGKKDKAGREKAYRERHFIISLFSKLKHYYAATSHRLQGASIKDVVVINSDISKNMCMVEQKKARYVACSRSVDNLFFYRGI